MADHIGRVGVMPIVITLAEKILETCRGLNFRKNDDMASLIKETKTRIDLVKVRLDVIDAYLRSSDGVPLRSKDSGGAALEFSLERLEELLRKMDGRLSSKDQKPEGNWALQHAWVSWRKDEMVHLNSQISRWCRHVQSIISAWNMLGKVVTGSEVHERLRKVQDQSLTAAVALRGRVQSGTPPTLPLLLSTLGLDAKLVEKIPRQLLPKDKPKYYVEQQELALGHWGARQKAGLEKLAYVFGGSHLPELNLLPCKGIDVLTHHTLKGHPMPPQKRFLALVYELPRGCIQSHYSDPPTLFQALHERETHQRFFISLEGRYQMAAQIAKAVTEIHAAGWAHKDIRSKNVIVDIRSSKASKRAEVGPSTCLIGFVASVDKVEDGRPHRQAELMPPVMTAYDIRQDIYCVGAVLVELGTQKTLDNLLTPHGKHITYEKRHAELLHHARHLEDKMGIKYSRAVLACLEIHTDPVKKTDTNAVLRSKFYEGVLLPLRQILEGFQVCHGT